MTPQKAKELLPIIQAFAEGKTIQFKFPGVLPWLEQDKENPDLQFGDFYEYRIKPEPKLRPWKPEEVPVGSLIRRKHCWPARWVIVCGTASGLGWFGMDGKFIFKNFDSLLSEFENYEHSTDGGKTWKPCGVEE